jgi:hypothetical protein
MAVPILIGWREDVKDADQGNKTPTTEAQRHGEKQKQEL